jgi:lipopolysaccharide/colanic/teichoic acid biosynthesis glycosyltransferase
MHRVMGGRGFAGAPEISGDVPVESAGFGGAIDIRLRREISHRRLAVSLARRFTRITALHLLDSLLLAAVMWVLATAWPVAAEVRAYIPAVILIFLLSLNAMSAYGPGEARRDRGRLFGATVLGSLILSCLAFLPPHLPFAPEFILAFGLAAFVTTAAGRKVVDLGMRQVYFRGIGLRRAIVIGSLHEVGQAIHRLRDDQSIDQYLLGHLTPEHQPDPASLGTISDLAQVVDEQDIQEVVIATILSPTTLREVTARVEPVVRGPCPLLRLHPARLEFPGLLIKRVFDIFVSAILVVLLAPLIALIAVAIKLDSPGPVFFRHQRVGIGGQRFMMWKFRSMVCDAEAREKELLHLNIYGERGTFKLKDDPRITRIGRILRRTSLDELPQLLNVVRGEMSLVGPRPALTNDIDRYEPHHFERLSVVPGITGPWQVGGRNLITDFETVIRLERQYIHNWSIWLDLKIMFRTIRVVIRGEGAY